MDIFAAILGWTEKNEGFTSNPCLTIGINNDIFGQHVITNNMISVGCLDMGCFTSQS